MKEAKNHWYDGWFYDTIIAPNQDKLFAQIKNLIEPGSNIIDVGCGTGRFAFKISDKSGSVLGVDISEKNIDRAKYNLSKMPDEKISFRHTTLNQLLSETDEHFDYAVSTYVIHEVDEIDRINLLKEMSAIAGKVIIGDYLYPKKFDLWNIINEAVEFAAGRNHYKNYKSFLAAGGIRGLANEAGLKIINENKNNPLTSHLIVLTK